jgi:hypothetical protein
MYETTILSNHRPDYLFILFIFAAFAVIIVIVWVIVCAIIYVPIWLIVTFVVNPASQSNLFTQIKSLSTQVMLSLHSETESIKRLLCNQTMNVLSVLPLMPLIYGVISVAISISQISSLSSMQSYSPSCFVNMILMCKLAYSNLGMLLFTLTSSCSSEPTECELLSSQYHRASQGT